MTEFEIGDDEYTEVNTSYDQDKEIGSTPSAYFAHSQPMNAKNGDNFMSIQRLDVGEEKLNNDDMYDEFIEDNFNFEDDYGLARGWDCKSCGKAFEEDESYLLVDHAKTHGVTFQNV